MHLQPGIQIADPVVLTAFARRHPFATVVTQGPDGIAISQLPIVCDAEPVRVRGHLARINPQASAIAAGGRVEIVFHGPQGYRSPDGSSGAPLLPTWNYLTVHAFGIAHEIDDAGTRAVLADTACLLEGQRDPPWRLESAPKLVTELFPLIQGFELREVRLQSRFKVTRDRDLGGRSQALSALRDSEDPVERELYELIVMAEQRSTDHRG